MFEVKYAVVKFSAQADVCFVCLTCSAVSRLLVSLSRARVASSSSSSLSCASFSVEICPSAVLISFSPCCTSCCSRDTCREDRQTEWGRENRLCPHPPLCYTSGCSSVWHQPWNYISILGSARWNFHQKYIQWLFPFQIFKWAKPIFFFC